MRAFIVTVFLLVSIILVSACTFAGAETPPGPPLPIPTGSPSPAPNPEKSPLPAESQPEFTLPGQIQSDSTLPALAPSSTPSTIASPSSAVPIEQDYRFAPDDMITVYVWMCPEVSTGGTLQAGALGNFLLVDVDGFISYPFLGRFKVAGMTAEELRLKITNTLSKYYNDPVVTVGLSQRRIYRIYVMGEVQRPGMYDMQKPQISISEAISLAGGTKTNAAVQRATLQRGDEVIPLDLSGLVYRGEGGPQVKLKPEDRLIIPEMRKKIAVIGAVLRQGLYDVRDEHTVLDAIALAGGYNERAKPNKVAIFRVVDGKRTIIPVDTRKIFAAASSPPVQVYRGRKIVNSELPSVEELSKNIELQDRDIIYVPQLNNLRWEDIYQSSIFLYYLRLLFPNP